MANENFKDRIIKVFNMDDDHYDDDVYDDDDQADTEKEEQPKKVFPTGKAKGSSRKAPALGLGTGPNVLVLNPQNFDEAPFIVKKIKEDRTIVVNLKGTEYEEGRKIFDFLSGAVFALEGTINRIAQSVYILAPNEVSVSTEINKEAEADDEITPLLEFDKN